jgi:hypothetical protein
VQKNKQIDKLVDTNLRKYLQEEKEYSKETLNQVSLFVYDLESRNSDLYELAQILPEEHLAKVIDYYDGAELKIPTKEEFKDCLLITIIFYLSEVKDFHWNDIKKFINLPEEEGSYVRLKKRMEVIKSKINRRLIDLLFEFDEEEIMEIVEKEKLRNRVLKLKDEE